MKTAEKFRCDKERNYRSIIHISVIISGTIWSVFGKKRQPIFLKIGENIILNTICYIFFISKDIIIYFVSYRSKETIWDQQKGELFTEVIIN